ncbi:MAG: PKD domain-containing protein [Nocardioides sp.]
MSSPHSAQAHSEEPSGRRTSRGHTRVAALAALVLGIAGLSVLSGGPAQALIQPSDTITTMSGNGEAGYAGDGGPAAQAQISQPRDTAEGPDGSLFVADTFNNRIRKIAKDGTITTIVGTGERGFSGDDGPALDATIAWPHDLTIAADGTLYFADSNNNRIRAVDTDGIIRTIAGTGGAGAVEDGVPALEARIPNPKSVLAAGNFLYVSSLDDRVRKIDLTSGVITTVAGNGTEGFAGDGGPAVEAQLSGPQRIARTADGTLYIADTGNHAVRRVDAETGLISTVAGTLGTPGRGADGKALDSALDSPRGLAVVGNELYLADSENHRVRRVDLADGTVTTLAGGETTGYSGDGGSADQALLFQPRGLTVTSAGSLVIADTFNSALRVITPATPNQAPTASLSADCTGLTCTFDGTASADPDGSVASWAWDFGHDAIATDAGTTTHTFADAGMHTVTLTVADELGASGSQALTLLLMVSNQGPSAAFSVACTGNDCTFDASGSTDADGEIASYAWDFGDGTVGTGVEARHVFVADPDPEDDVPPLTEATVSLAVTDDSGATGSTSVIVPITP